MKKNIILVVVCLYFSSCNLISSKSDKYVGFWQGIVVSDLDTYTKSERPITIEITENTENNLLVTIHLNNKKTSSDIYFFKDDCLVKNGESICYNEGDKTLILSLGTEPIVLKKLDTESITSLINIERELVIKDSIQKYEDSSTFAKYKAHPELLDDMMMPGDTGLNR
ncbi:MAG: hypothetical protein ACOYMA_13775 [Bacteroidia bacterium]